MNGELLRLIDGLHREKGIDQDVLFNSIETALLTALRKHYPNSKELKVIINRENGDITAQSEAGPIDPSFLGRISAQTAKQVIIQKIREAENMVIQTEMSHKQGDIITGTVQGTESGALIVNIGKAEGIIPRNEQIPGEVYRVGERIKALLLITRKEAGRVNIILSRSHPNFIRRLFEIEVPEISDKSIEIRELSREAGARTKIAVWSGNPKIDAVGACVGVRGNRIKNIMDEVGSEKLDIIRWDEAPEAFIKNAMKPAEVESVELIPENKRARVFVRPDQLSLAIGKKGQNIRLACRLTGWEIDVMSPAEKETGRQATNEATPPSTSERSPEVSPSPEEPAETKTTEIPPATEMTEPQTS